MQVDPIKPKSKPPETKRLKLNYDEPPSNFEFKFKLRRHIEVSPNALFDVQVAGRHRCYSPRHRHRQAF